MIGDVQGGARNSLAYQPPAHETPPRPAGDWAKHGTQGYFGMTMLDVGANIRANISMALDPNSSTPNGPSARSSTAPLPRETPLDAFANILPPRDPGRSGQSRRAALTRLSLISNQWMGPCSSSLLRMLLSADSGASRQSKGRARPEGEPGDLASHDPAATALALNPEIFFCSHATTLEAEAGCWSMTHKRSGGRA